MIKRLLILLTVLILGFSSVTLATIVQYNISGNIPCYISGQVEESLIFLPIGGIVSIWDEGNIPNNTPTVTYDIIGYNITIGDYHIIQEGLGGYFHFGTHDVYVNIGGGLYSECFAGPWFYTHWELPDSFAVQGGPPTAWKNCMYEYRNYTFAMEGLSFNITPVPEPTTMLLIGSGLLVIAGFRKKLEL